MALRLRVRSSALPRSLLPSSLGVLPLSSAGAASQKRFMSSSQPPNSSPTQLGATVDKNSAPRSGSAATPAQHDHQHPPSDRESAAKAHDHGPAHAHKHGHSGHSHSHSLNPFASHSHSHGPGPSPSSLVDALTGKGDPGSRVTLYGLASNIGLTGLKLIAGWRFNSASLLAEAGHSASDLLGDFVTLFCYNMSRRPPTKLFPHGLGKFDAVGMWTVSAILVLGSVGIGLHSYNLLTMVHFNAPNVLSSLPHLPDFLPTHAHSHDIALDEHGAVLDPNAAWIALLSVGIKEWMYRLTKRVGEEEGSSVLLANALHHRSDALTSFIALLSILGSHAGLPVLDPLGGMLVSLLLLKQSSAMTWRSTLDLLDASCSEEILRDVQSVLADLQEEALNGGIASGSSQTWEVRSVKGLNGGAGARIEIELTFITDNGRRVGLAEAERVAKAIEERVKEAEGVAQVRVHFTEVAATGGKIEPPVSEADKR